MPNFSGKFQYLNTDGSALQSGPCRVSFEKETFTLLPQGGTPMAFDLGDVDGFVPGDYELTLTLYTGKKIVLNQFGKTFQNLSHDLLEAYRARLIQCLLLEDLEEVARFEGFARLESPTRAFSSPAEFRLYQSTLAVLPTAATGLQWRLADIDAVQFDEANYAVTLESAGERMEVTKLAKRTGEFHQRLQDAISELTRKGAEIVREMFPFLNPDQFQQVVQLMKEGRAAPLAKLKAIHSQTEAALGANVVDAQLKPYFEALMKQTPEGWLYAGFKLLRKEKTEEEAAAVAAAAAQATEEAAPPQPAADAPAPEEPGEEEEPILHWFFFPLAAKPGSKLPSNLVAWEATSKSGRATYFFRLLPPEQAAALQDAAKAPALVDGAIRQLNRAIVLLNFRREPIYLPDNSLELQPRYHRYAIACRRIPELRRLRASFLGRAIHTSPQAWQKQFEGFLAKA